MNIPFNPPVKTIAELLHKLGDIPAERVRFTPVPGTATIDDLSKPENDLCELVEGTLVEKAGGWSEADLESWLLLIMKQFVSVRNLGAVIGGTGLIELTAGSVRAPDVAFYSWDRMPGRRLPSDPIPQLVPELAVEVLSRSNTPAETANKRDEYFRSGVRLVWQIDPRARIVRVYTAADQFTDFTAADTLDGGAVLPGFTLPLSDLFAELDRHG